MTNQPAGACSCNGDHADGFHSVSMCFTDAALIDLRNAVGGAVEPTQREQSSSPEAVVLGKVIEELRHDNQRGIATWPSILLTFITSELESERAKR